MGKALVPRDVPLVDYAENLETTLRVASMRGRLLTDPATIRPRLLAGGKHLVNVRMLVPAEPQTWRERMADFDRRNPIAGPVLRALAFVGALFALGATLLTVAALILRESIGTGGLIAVLLTVAAIALVAWNRTNHRGTCPGITIHCPRCGGH